jgi:hypothetical protein
LKLETTLAIFLIGLGIAVQLVAFSTQSHVLLASMEGEAAVNLAAGLVLALAGPLRSSAGRKAGIAVVMAVVLVVSVGSFVYFDTSYFIQQTFYSESSLSTEGGKTVLVRILGGGLFNQTGQQVYSPGSIKLVLSTNNTVVWKNVDVSHHTVTGLSRVFESGNINPGQSFTHTFTETGEFSYTCDYHPWMKGKIIVTSG